jgi:hypothetical protein
MNAQWDIEVYDRDVQLVLAAEVKSKTNASPAWAAQLRRNILAHGIYPNPPYFLMAFPDQFFLWSGKNSEKGDDEPDYRVDARPILQPYTERVKMEASQLSSQSLELIIISWLAGIIHAAKSGDQIDQPDGWLAESGLFDAIAGGKFAREVAV